MPGSPICRRRHQIKFINTLINNIKISLHSLPIKAAPIDADGWAENGIALDRGHQRPGALRPLMARLPARLP